MDSFIEIVIGTIVIIVGTMLFLAAVAYAIGFRKQRSSSKSPIDMQVTYT